MIRQKCLGNYRAILFQKVSFRIDRFFSLLIEAFFYCFRQKIWIETLRLEGKYQTEKKNMIELFSFIGE